MTLWIKQAVSQPEGSTMNINDLIEKLEEIQNLRDKGEKFSVLIEGSTDGQENVMLEYSSYDVDLFESSILTMSNLKHITDFTVQTSKEYQVNLVVRGEVIVTVEASDEESARDLAYEAIDDNVDVSCYIYSDDVEVEDSIYLDAEVVSSEEI